jgi:hypothetical protein
MSSGALVQLVAYGAQDIYLTGEPQLTFFKTVYRRHTNYAIESIHVPITGTINPGAKISVSIPRSGDLLKGLWIHYNPSQLIPANNPTNVAYICSDIGHALFDQFEIEIGGQIIDTQYGKWLSIWRDLKEKNTYGTAGLICDLYPNFSSTFYSDRGFSINSGDMMYITSQGEEPPNNYKFPTATNNPLYKYNVSDSTGYAPQPYGQTQIITNNLGKSAGNNMISGTQEIRQSSFLPSVQSTINFVTHYDTMAYTHIGSQNLNTKFIGDPFFFGDDHKFTTQKVNISTANAPTEAYIPMQFWFCRNPGLALPLIALQYHEVKFNITFATIDKWVKPLEGTTVETNINNIQIFAEYVYLDVPERKKFTSDAHEYLIDQVQLRTIDPAEFISKNTVSFDINLNHPVKELIFTGNPEHYVKNNPYNPNNYQHQGRTASGASACPILSTTAIPLDFGSTLSYTNTKMTLSFNGIDRFSPRNLKYFTREQIYKYHKNSGGGHYFTDDIGVYSFSLDPDDIQPSGSCNMSRIDRITIKFTDFNTVPGQTETLNPLDIYAVNYNILRIMSGMGGLAYMN